MFKYNSIEIFDRFEIILKPNSRNNISNKLRNDARTSVIFSHYKEIPRSSNSISAFNAYSICETTLSLKRIMVLRMAGIP